MNTILIKNARIVNEGRIEEGDVLIKNGFIEKIASDIIAEDSYKIIDASGKYLLPGAIDDQVHFREPGLTHKANIYTESRSAVAGGVTTFMEMPNTVPQAVTQELLDDKYKIAAKDALANYSFFMGATNNNLDEVLKTDKNSVCGVKVFMGSSTGNMLVDDPSTLERLFANCELLIATHCEDENTVKANEQKFREKYGEEVPIILHPEIRSEEACYLSSSMAVDLAKKNGTKLHILHISTAKELALFDNSIPLEQKKITSEACIHHMWFNRDDYKEKGTLIKWNPAVKEESDRLAIIKAVNENIIDVIATDHAPHTIEEKQNTYFKAPSGGPLVQHSIQALLDMVKKGWFTIEKVVEKMAHHPAILFQVDRRGFIREGYWADLVLVDPNKPQQVSKENILYKCGWSPFEGHTFSSTITHTIISGVLKWENGRFCSELPGERVLFERG